MGLFSKIYVIRVVRVAKELEAKWKNWMWLRMDAIRFLVICLKVNVCKTSNPFAHKSHGCDCCFGGILNPLYMRLGSLISSTYVNDCIQFDALIAVQVFAINRRKPKKKLLILIVFSFLSLSFFFFFTFFVGYLLRVSIKINKTATDVGKKNVEKSCDFDWCTKNKNTGKTLRTSDFDVLKSSIFGFAGTVL